MCGVRVRQRIVTVTVCAHTRTRLVHCSNQVFLARMLHCFCAPGALRGAPRTGSQPLAHTHTHTQRTHGRALHRGPGPWLTLAAMRTPPPVFKLRWQVCMHRRHTAASPVLAAAGAAAALAATLDSSSDADAALAGVGAWVGTWASRNFSSDCISWGHAEWPMPRYLCQWGVHAARGDTHTHMYHTIHARG